MKKGIIVIALALVAVAAIYIIGKDGSEGTKSDIVVGTYGEHLYVYSFDNETLEFTQKAKAEAENPSYALADKGSVFAASEVGEESGAYSFEVKRGGKDVTRSANRRQTGADPCFVMMHKEEDGSRYMLTADYSGGSISVFPVYAGYIEPLAEQIFFEGSGPVTDRQEASHIHQLRAVPGVRGFILASDLGADVIRLIGIGKKDGEIKLTHIKDFECPAGSGPRHMEFSQDGHFMYCIAELSGNVLAYRITNDDGTPVLTLVQEIQADEVNAGGSADIHIHPNGRWLYTSHRLENDGISVFNILENGTLEKIGYARTGRHPRNFMITSDGKHLLVACRDDRTIQVFKIEEEGTLTLTQSTLDFDVDMPSSVLEML